MTRLLTFARQNRKEAERFIKFLFVGALGFVIDFGAFNLIHSLLHADLALARLITSDPGAAQKIALVISSTTSFIAAVISNFFWNRYWTYPESRAKPIRRQLAQFFLVNTAGYIIRTPILLTLTNPYTRLVSGLSLPFEPAKLGANLALGTAVGTVLLWNFFVNRYWTYNDIR